MNTYIVELIAGVFFFATRSCEYSTTTKEENKRTLILQKEDIQN